MALLLEREEFYIACHWRLKTLLIGIGAE